MKIFSINMEIKSWLDFEVVFEFEYSIFGILGFLCSFLDLDLDTETLMVLQSFIENPEIMESLKNVSGESIHKIYDLEDYCAKFEANNSDSMECYEERAVMRGENADFEYLKYHLKKHLDLEKEGKRYLTEEQLAKFSRGYHQWLANHMGKEVYKQWLSTFKEK